MRPAGALVIQRRMPCRHPGLTRPRNRLASARTWYVRADGRHGNHADPPRGRAQARPPHTGRREMDLQRKVYRMNWPKLKSFGNGRLGRMVVVLGVAGLLLGAGAGAAEAAMGTQPGTVNLVPTSGPTSSTPTWATTVSCPSGFQGSATFKEVHSDGATTNLIAPIVNGTAAPFTG